MPKALFTILLLTLVACAKPNNRNSITPGGSSNLGGGIRPSTPVPSDDGGQDSGGGDHFQSGERRVKTIFENQGKLIELLNNIIQNLRFYKPAPKGILTSYEELYEYSEFLDKWFNAYSTEKIPLEKLFENVSFQDICLNEDNEITSATINVQKKGMLCINLKKLAVIPEESLEKQLHVLLMHEYTHLIKLTHEDGVILQNIVFDLYSLLSAQESASTRMLRGFRDIVETTIISLQELAETPKSKLIYPDLVNDKIFATEFRNLNAYQKTTLLNSINWLIAEAKKSKAPEAQEILKTLNYTKEELQILQRFYLASYAQVAMNPANTHFAISMLALGRSDGPPNNVYNLPNIFNKLIVVLKKCQELDLAKLKIVPVGNTHTYEKGEITKNPNHKFNSFKYMKENFEFKEIKDNINKSNPVTIEPNLNDKIP